MAWSSWQRVGEGFTSADKRCHKVIKSSKGEREKLSQQPQEYVQTLESKTQPVINDSKWNPKDFLSSFSVPLQSRRYSKDVLDSQKEEKISWCDSSSEDEDAEASKGKPQQSISCERPKKKQVSNSNNLQTSTSRQKRPAAGLTSSCKSKSLKSESHSTAQTETCHNNNTDSSWTEIEKSYRFHSGTSDSEEGIKQNNEFKFKTYVDPCKESKQFIKCKNSNQQSSIKISHSNSNSVEIEQEERQFTSTPHKWSISSFDSVNPNNSTRLPGNNRKTLGQERHLSRSESYEDVNIDDSGSECENDDNNDVIRDEKVEDFDDMEDITTDESDGSITSQKISKTNLCEDRSTLSQDRVSQQVEIGSVASSTVSPSPSSQRVGASDWAIRFQQEVSPNLNEKDCAKETNQHDSVKKKQRVSSKSLVGQLSRLINREKSTMRFWQHSSSKGTWNADNNQKSVTLVIISMVKQFSLYVAQCRVVVDNDLLLHQAMNCQLMLVRSHADQMGVQSGNTIQVFPPWKQMDEGKTITILCANQVRVVSPGSDSESNGVEQVCTSTDFEASGTSTTGNATEKEEKTKVSFKWACPCRQNPSIQNNKCPAYQSDHYIKFFSQMALRDKTSPYLPPTTTTLHLHSVLSSTQPRFRELQRTLLQSIQDERAGESEISCMPPFSATVLRVFRQKSTSQSSVCLSVLVQDSSGMLALIEYEDIDKTSQNAVWLKLFRAVGKECLCQGLSLVNRRTKEKDPSLFQVMARAWRGGNLAVTDSQGESQTSQQMHRKLPSFCYILQCVGEVENCLQEMETAERKEGLDLVRLGHVVTDKNCHERFSFVANVIDVQDCSHMSSEKRHSSFVYDASNDKVQGFTTFIPLSMDEMCVQLERREGSKGQMCLLLDVSWNGDAIYADEYSNLLPQSTWSSLGVDRLIDQQFVTALSKGVVTVPAVGQSSLANSFVKVTGHIVHINEDKCYSWEGCGLCGTELITTHETGRSQCPACQKETTHPETRMSMEVDILEDSCKDFIIRINLSQSTITSILPEEVPNEGYDMDLVLGKSISAVGYVVDRTKDTFQLYEVDLK